MMNEFGPHGFLAGTNIAIPQGQKPVEALRIGDWVETLHGGTQQIKWIGRCTCTAEYLAANPQMRPVCILAGAIEEGIPSHDLWISAGIGICIDGGLIPAAILVNGASIIQEPAVEPVEYFQIEFEEHEVLIAQACPVESFNGEIREQYENAAEFDALYPEPLPWPMVPCLPRLEEGFVLDAIQQRLNEQAGITRSEAAHGPLRGFVDKAGPTLAAGWAQCETEPEIPVCLDIMEDGIRILRTLANRYRNDLRTAGLGSGHHAFSVELPEGTTGPIEIRRTIDQQPLPLTDAALAQRGVSS